MTDEEMFVTLPTLLAATRFQKANQEFIDSNPEIKKKFKDMQRFAKNEDQLSAFDSAMRVLESLTGYPDLSAWIIGQFDLEF